MVSVGESAAAGSPEGSRTAPGAGRLRAETAAGAAGLGCVIPLPGAEVWVVWFVTERSSKTALFVPTCFSLCPGSECCVSSKGKSSSLLLTDLCEHLPAVLYLPCFSLILEVFCFLGCAFAGFLVLLWGFFYCLLKVQVTKTM